MHHKARKHNTTRINTVDIEEYINIDNQCTLLLFFCNYANTVPIFNSCTKCVGSQGKKKHDRTPDCRPDFWAWMHGRAHN